MLENQNIFSPGPQEIFECMEMLENKNMLSTVPQKIAKPVNVRE